MSSDLLFALELIVVLGAVIGFGFWQLHVLKRDDKERSKPGEDDDRPGDPPA